MEMTFSELRAKEIINTQDGRKLGKACDIVFCYPENRWLGIVAPGGGVFSWKKNGVFIPLKDIVKIGEDVILVNVGFSRKQTKKTDPRTPMCSPPPADMAADNRRNFDEFE